MIKTFLQKIILHKWKSFTNASYNEKGGMINCRCFLCGDSKRKNNKRRFYYNLKENVFFCHNCLQKGNIKTLINHFPNLDIDYKELNDYINNQQIKDFINDKLDTFIEQKEEYELYYPIGSRLDLLIKDNNYKYLSIKDKNNFIMAIKYLKNREVSSEWFERFYFVFNEDEKLRNYILTLFEYDNLCIWSGRKYIDENKKMPKYFHLKHFPFHKVLGFQNDINIKKGIYIYVTEGFFDSLILNQEGLNSVCVWGLNNMIYTHPPLSILRKKYELIFVPDNDDSFDIFNKINKNFQDSIRIKKIEIGKDVNDMKIQLKDNFKEEFLKIKDITLYQHNIEKEIKEIGK